MIDTTFGPQSAAVAEVVSWANTGEVFAAHRSRSPEGGLIVVTDLERACEIADLEEPDGKPDSPSGSWSIMTGVFESPFRSTATARSVREPIRAALGPFEQRALERLPQDVDLPIRTLAASWALKDIRAIALQRACLGIVPNSFFEDLFDLYRRGYWPCGWRDASRDPTDDWPAPGSFIVWRRAE